MNPLNNVTFAKVLNFAATGAIRIPSLMVSADAAKMIGEVALRGLTKTPQLFGLETSHNSYLDTALFGAPLRVYQNVQSVELLKRAAVFATAGLATYEAVRLLGGKPSSLYNQFFKLVSPFELSDRTLVQRYQDAGNYVKECYKGLKTAPATTTTPATTPATTTTTATKTTEKEQEPGSSAPVTIPPADQKNAEPISARLFQQILPSVTTGTMTIVGSMASLDALKMMGEAAIRGLTLITSLAGYKMKDTSSVTIMGAAVRNYSHLKSPDLAMRTATFAVIGLGLYHGAEALRGEKTPKLLNIILGLITPLKFADRTWVNDVQDKVKKGLQSTNTQASKDPSVAVSSTQE